MTRRLFVASCLGVLASACSSGSGASIQSPTAPSAPSAARLSSSRTSYQFPTTLVGQSAVSPDFVLSADRSALIDSVTSSNPTEFTVTNPSNCVGVTVTSTSGCVLTIKFQPASSGVHSAQILVNAGGSSIAVDVFGPATSPNLSPAPPGPDSSGGSSSGGGGDGGGGTATSSGSFSQAPCIPNGTGSLDVHIINSTAFPVKLTFTGPVTQSTTLLPTAISILSPPPGNYTISGEAVGASSVTIRSSSWILASGCDYVLQLVSGSSALTLR